MAKAVAQPAPQRPKPGARFSNSRTMDFATKGATIAAGLGVMAGAALSLLTWGLGPIVLALTLGLVVNGCLGGAIGAGVAFVTRNEVRKPACAEFASEKWYDEKAQAQYHQAPAPCPCDDKAQDAPSTYFQDKVCESPREEALVQR